MRQSIVLALCAGAALAAAPPERAIRALPLTPPIAKSLIVGRAACRGVTWLLTEQPQLIHIAHVDRRVSLQPVRGFLADDRVWGLACLEDATLWTLANARTLARIGTDGVVRERIELSLPRLALFGRKDRLLFVQLPLVAGMPLLSTAQPRRPSDVRAWPGIFSRPARSRPEALTANLVNCGISSDDVLPCWLPDEDRATLSDGVTARTVRFGVRRTPGNDASAPIWDLAVAPGGSLWVLATMVDGEGHRVGGRLIHTDASGAERSATALESAARIIVSAGDGECVLLSTRGDLVHVVQR